MKPGAGHVPYADGMRVVAIIGVVALHRSAIGVLEYGQIPSDQWWIANGIDSACRWVVPVFIMLSGCLNLSRTQQREILPFYKKRFQRVGIPLLFWSPLYFACHVAFEGRELTPEFIVSSLAGGLTINHLYFIFILLMLYLLTPVFDLLIYRTNKTTVLILGILLFVPDFFGVYSQSIPKNAVTLFIPYIPYYFMGYALRSFTPEKKILFPALLFYFIASATIAIQTGNLVGQYGIEGSRGLAFYEYYHPAVAVQAVCVWLILSHIFSIPMSKKMTRSLQFLGRASFGVYLTHVLFLGLIYFYDRSFFVENIAWSVLSDTLIVFITSALLTSALIHTQYLRTIVGEIKSKGEITI